MPKSKKIQWEVISRRGTAQPLLVIDSLVILFKMGNVAKSHKIKWNPASYRQFDNARWFSLETRDGYLNMLKKGEEKNKGFLLRNGQEYNKRIVAYRRFADKYKDNNFSIKTNKEIADIFSEWFEYSKQFWSFAYDYIFINKYLPEQVAAAVEQKVPDVMKQNEYLGILFMADQLSEMWQEKKSLMDLAFMVKKERWKLSNPVLNKKIVDHLNKFAHLGFYYFRGEAHTPSVIRRRLKEYMASSDKQFKQAYIDIKNQKNNVVHTQQLIRKLKLNNKTAYTIKIIKRWGALSNFVDETYSYVVHQMRDMWQEIGKRLGGLTLREMASLRAQEIVANLKKSQVPALVKKEARTRLKDHAFGLDKGKIFLFTGKALAKYRKQEQVNKVSYDNIKQLKGQAASPGIVKGTVRVVYSIHDLKKVERGNIMVTDATNPTYVPAMERSAAIVTDEGGLLCHAAIVSRELKVPCVVGTEIGTKVLHDGDKVEVDATKGVVRKL